MNYANKGIMFGFLYMAMILSVVFLLVSCGEPPSQSAQSDSAYVKSEQLRIVCYQYRTYYGNMVSSCLQLNTADDLAQWKVENGIK